MSNTTMRSYTEATGVIDYNMTNNYMFRFILQKNQKVLKGLICALLHLDPNDVKTVEITNPIDLSGNVAGKEFILDIKVILNNNTLINLEMQVTNEYNWTDRSLGYLCRSYDHLHSGQEYIESKPVIHIGILAFTLFKDEPEFYATYKLKNIKNNRVYSDKFILSVLDLNYIELATDEDKAYKIDYWARLFMAKTWEELTMLAKNNEYLEEAAQSIYIANADEIVRQQCLAREDAERLHRTLIRDNNQLRKELEDKDRIIKELTEKLANSKKD